MEFKSVQKFVIMSPQKLREVALLAKKMRPIDAVERLAFVHRRASFALVKVITSALANAKQKGVDTQKLTFKEIQINEGPKLKRWRAGARGRAKPYKKRMSHIRVVLSVKDDKKTESVSKVVGKSESEKLNIKNRVFKLKSKIKNERK